MRDFRLPAFVLISALGLSVSGAFASTTDCSSADGHFRYHRFRSDGGAVPPPGMQDPRWMIDGVETPSIQGEFDPKTKVVIASKTCPAWTPGAPSSSCQFNEEDSVLKATLRGLQGAESTATVLMLCHSTQYVGPPRP